MAEPKVRFKRDDGSSYPAWTIVPLSKLSVPSGIKNKNDADLESYSISNERGFVPQNEQFEDAGYLNNADRSLYYIVKPGSFAYNPARISIGSIGYQNVGKDVLVSSLYEIFNTTDDLDDGFLMNWFKTEQFQKHVRRLSEGGVRQYFYYDKLCMVKFSLPCLEEQQKIADFLSSVDTVITASEEEVANLETQKKAVMKKVFSQEVRFKRADGSVFPEWEEDNVGNRCNIQTGKSNTQDSVEDGEYPFYVRSPIVYRSNRYLFDTEAVITVGDGVGTGKVYHYVEGKFDLHQRAYAMTDFVGMTGRYFYYYFSAFFYDRVRAMTAKTSVDSVRYEMIDKMTIRIPCLEEQCLIADFLSDFDEAIAAAKKELELWKELKKGLLQQMFV